MFISQQVRVRRAAALLARRVKRASEQAPRKKTWAQRYCGSSLLPKSETIVSIEGSMGEIRYRAWKRYCRKNFSYLKFREGLPCLGKVFDDGDAMLHDVAHLAAGGEEMRADAVDD